MNIDADLHNADWMKTTWDLGVDNVADLRALLKRLNIAVRAFKQLPVYRWNVGKLPWLKRL